MTSKKIDISKIDIGPVIHETLPRALVDRIKAYKTILGDAEPASLADTIADFKCDLHPEHEVAVWERIAFIYQTFIAHHAITELHQRQDVYATLVGASCGATGAPEPLSLTTKQIAELRAHFIVPS